MIEKVFSKTASTTLNADEAVSRGCALQCAILSPVFKVREFSVTDIQPYPIKLVWDNTGGEGAATGEMEVFPANHPVPFSKMLTFYKSSTFQVGKYTSSIKFYEILNILFRSLENMWQRFPIRRNISVSSRSEM